MSDADVVIAGAGPAGSAAALVLARAGVRVLLLDASTFPRDKICGDLLGTDAVATLAQLGIRDTVLARATPVAGAVLFGPRGIATGAAAATSACVLPRRDLDARLVACARAAGASIVRARVTGALRHDDGTIVGVTTDGGDIRARAIVGADGWGSAVARSIGAARSAVRDVAVAVRAYACDVAPLGGAMRFYVNRAGDGYGWIFPLGEDRANVGLGFVRGEAGAGDPHAALQRFVARDGPASAFLASATLQAARAWPIPLAGRIRPLAVRGAYLVGDAASLASPLSGSGIANALASGMLAANAIVRSLAGDSNAHERYARVVTRSIGWRLCIEDVAHRTCGTPARVEPWLTLARRVPMGERALARALLALG